MSYNFLYKTYLNRPPGLSRTNQPVSLNDFWKKQGDNSYIQILTSATNTNAYAEINNFINSNGVLSNASYIKIKSVSISYLLPDRFVKKLHLAKFRYYISSNNLLLFTKFKGTDPETVDIFTLPPLRTITCGLQVSF
jgi:hypothetical protein